MGVDYLVVAMDRTRRIFDAEAFEREVQEKWPALCVSVNSQCASEADVVARIKSSELQVFIIDHFPDNRALRIDGDVYVSAEVAAWVRYLHPDPDLALWLIDDAFSAHVVLHPGITTDEIHAGWVDHREHDPYEEYPQYFPME